MQGLGRAACIADTRHQFDRLAIGHAPCTLSPFDLAGGTGSDSSPSYPLLPVQLESASRHEADRLVAFEGDGWDAEGEQPNEDVSKARRIAHDQTGRRLVCMP